MNIIWNSVPREVLREAAIEYLNMSASHLATVLSQPAYEMLVDSVSQDAQFKTFVTGIWNSAIHSPFDGD